MIERCKICLTYNHIPDIYSCSCDVWECYNCKNIEWFDDDSLYDYMTRFNKTLDEAEYDKNNLISTVKVSAGEMSC